jgi:archaellum biogenesis ATPase FlaH
MKPEFNDEIFKQNLKAEGLTTSEVTKHILKKANEVTSKKGLFMVKEANQWIEEAKIRPIPNMLFSEFWHEGELCILFADTNTGKSILAVQIGNSIAQGQPIPGFKLQANSQKVLYLDFELSDKQFEVRYSENYNNHYHFCENFLRAEIDPDAEFAEGKFEEFLYSSLEKSIKETQCKILIVDNITYLKNETEKAKDALPLMKHLKALKSKFNLSILALAHTPKRDATKPINRNDLSGSKMLINFCDSSFAIGESQQESGARYLKQIKARNTEIKFDSENVMLCQIAKPINFLMFEFITHANEHAHLKTLGPNQKEELIFRAKDLQKEGKSQRQIAEELEIGLGTVNKYLKT